MATTYKVIFTGKLKPEVTQEQAHGELVSSFGLSAQQADALLKAKPPVVVKKGITLEQGKSLGRRLIKIGLVVKLIKQGAAPVDKITLPPPVPPDPEQLIESAVAEKQEYVSPEKVNINSIFRLLIDFFDTAKEIIKTQIAAFSSDKATEDTPATPSTADPAATTSSPDAPFFTPAEKVKTLTYGEKSERGKPEKVPVMHGYRWLVYAFDMLKEYPLQWVVVVIGLVFILGISNLITFGLSSFLFPVFIAGLMLGAHEQESGNEFRFNHFIAGFTTNRNQLLLLGVIAAVGVLICSLPLLGFSMVAALFNGGAGAETKSALSVILIIIGGVLGGALSVLLSMSMWFAPILVAVEKMNAVPAVKVSFKAARKNILPFTVFAVSSIAVFALLTLAATFMIPLIFSGGFQLSSIFMVLPVLLEILLILPIIALVMISMYTSYRDIFYQ